MVSQELHYAVEDLIHAYVQCIERTARRTYSPLICTGTW